MKKIIFILLIDYLILILDVQDPMEDIPLPKGEKSTKIKIQLRSNNRTISTNQSNQVNDRRARS